MILSRRNALRAGAASAVLLGIGAGRAAATVPTSQYFDITKPSYDLFRNKMLHESHHVMQGFTFDSANQRLFIVQEQNGSSGDDLCVNQLDLTGKVVGSMHLNSAGHGVSIGAEAVGSSTYIWMECDSDGPTGNGRGTALARFKFVNGAKPAVTKFLTGSRTITCATDPINKRIVVRRSVNNQMQFSLYTLADAAAGKFTAPLAQFVQPPLSDKAVTFQGYCIYGQYLYTLDGEGHADSADINSYVTCIDMSTGTVKNRAFTKAGSTLVFREPEGMGVYRAPSGETRLCLGFGSRSSLNNINRYANIFYKKDLLG